jgi:uncharacterized protein DUF4245
VSEQPAAAPEQPSRYDRSFGGLVAAMIATVVFVAAYVGFRALTRDQPDIDPRVDYASCVAYLQDADLAILHPATLPPDWSANSVHFEQGDPPSWRMGMVTAGDEFVGVVQQQEDVDELLDHYVDGSAQQGADASPANTVGVTAWQTWSDSGGDHAFSAELGAGPLAGQTLLVYGSASVDDLETVIALLTLDPVGSSVSAADCDTGAL